MGDPANWKVAIENYLECYHCPVAHPGFSKVMDVDPDAYLLRSHGCLLDAACARKGIRALGEGACVRGERRGHAGAVSLRLAEHDGERRGRADEHVRRHHAARGAERTVGLTDYYFAEDVDDETVRGIMAFANQVGLEDAALVASVQRGLGSGMIPHGRLLLSSEHLIQHFQNLVFAALTR